MNKRVNVFILLLILSQNICAKNYHVSTLGKDNNQGTISEPFLTIQRAANLMIAGDTCFIHEGTYRETIIPANSGAEGNPIVFTAYNCAKVTVNGTDIVKNNWEPYKGNIYKTYMPWTMGAGKDFVFVNGQPLLQARHPNVSTNKSVWKMPPTTNPLSPFWPHNFGNFEADESTDWLFNEEDLNQTEEDYWKGAFYLGFHDWSWSMQSADIISSSKGKVQFGNQCDRFWFPHDFNMTRYEYLWDTIQSGYLTNHIHALDMLNEWHWQDDTLYLWTENIEDPALVVEAKKRQLAFNLMGRDFITIQNINIIASSLNLYDADNCVINGCRISYLSHFLRYDDTVDLLIEDGGVTKFPNEVYKMNVTIDNPIYKGEVGIIIGGNNNEVKNSIIEYSSGAGLYMVGNNTIVENCIIHDCGYSGTYIGPIIINRDFLNPEKITGGHTIKYCDLYNAPRALIYISGTPEHKQTFFRAMDISYNRIHDGCITGNDGGLIYGWWIVFGLGGQEKTHVHHNLIWDQWGTFWQGLVYPDNMCYKMEVHDNILWHSDINLKTVPEGLFWKKGGNSNGCNQYNNSMIKGHAGGVASLKSEDYPGGFFTTGPNFTLETHSCNVENITALRQVTNESFGLKVFPNPASSELNISFNLDQSQPVKMALYDVLGRENKVIEQGNRQAGVHRFTQDVSDMKNGVYLLQLISEKLRDSKMILINR